MSDTIDREKENLDLIEDNPVSDKPQIPKLLLGVSALLFLMILVAGAFTARSLVSERNKIPDLSMTMEQDNQNLSNEIELAGSDEETLKQKQLGSEYPLSGGDVRISSIESGLHVMGSNLSNVAESMMEFRSSIAMLEQRMSVADQERKALQEKTTHQQARGDQLGSDIAQIHALLSSQGNLLEQLKSTLDKQDTILGQLQRERASVPPFVLLSVDDWGKQRHAVIEMDGMTSLARPGEVRAGWRVVSVLPDRIHLVRLSDDLEYEMLREGNR